MSAARVSCVVPVYNGERFLAEALESILRQTHPPFETIIVDDGSTDGTAEVARSFAPRVRILHQENSGPVTARNRGIAEARGEFLAFLDADDIWDPEKLAKQTACFERNPGLAYVASLVQNFWEDEVADEGERMKGHRRSTPIPGYVTQAMMFRRTWFEKIGPLNASLKHGDSTDWIQRANEMGAESHLLEEVLLYRRLHLNNYSRTADRGSRDEFLSLLKSRLDRRRGAETEES